MFQEILHNTHENTFAGNLSVYIPGAENHGVVYFRSIRSQKLTERRILHLVTILQLSVASIVQMQQRKYFSICLKMADCTA